MKAMKGLSMNKVLDGIKRRPTNRASSGSGANNNNNNIINYSASATPQDESPEAIATRNVRAFCESGGQENADDEVTFLPAIVDAAESSPGAAAECARIIRKYISKDYSSKPSYQYNAVMLMRILADNPGPTFTRNLDKKFLDASKELLRYGRDSSVRQIFMETLDSFEISKPHDEGLRPLVEMWRKEKEKAYKAFGGPPLPPPPVPRVMNAPPFSQQNQGYYPQPSHHGRGKQLPNQIELANRLEEARTSAKLLQQVVACTPPAEFLSNDLIKEFADRCSAASRSVQGYMSAENPSPDNDTMESLIDTNELLQQALNTHKRAVLNARKHLGLGDPQQQPPQKPQQQSPHRTATSSPVSPIDTPTASVSIPNGSSSRAVPPPPVPSRKAVGKQRDYGAGSSEAAVAGPSRSSSGTPKPVVGEEENPFRDPVEEPAAGKDILRGVGASSASALGISSTTTAPGQSSNDSPPRLAFEPYHPGFTSANPAIGASTGAGGGSSNSIRAENEPEPVPRGTAATGRDRSLTKDSESDLYDDDDYKGGSKGGMGQGSSAVYHRY